MNIFLNNQIQRNRTLLDIMFGRKVQNTKTNKNMQSGRRDIVTISSEAQELSMKKSISGRTRNTSVDSTIDLQKYIDDARESNRAALENAGNEIDVNAVTYTDNSQAFRAALTDKYSKLAAEARTHSILPETYDVLMAGAKANLVVTDPPYNANYEGTAGKIKNDHMEDENFYQFLFAAFVNMEQHMEQDASIYVFHADTEGLNFRSACNRMGDQQGIRRKAQ